jgi:hypothetical protein
MQLQQLKLKRIALKRENIATPPADRISFDNNTAHTWQENMNIHACVPLDA